MAKRKPQTLTFRDVKYSLMADFGDAVLAKKEDSEEIFFIIEKLGEIFKVEARKTKDELRVLIRGNTVFLSGISIGIKTGCDSCNGNKHIYVKKSNRTMTFVVDNITLLSVFIPAFG